MLALMPMQNLANNSVMIFNDDIPDFVEPSMDALYGSLYATLAHLQLHDAVASASTYARWEQGQLAALFLFRRQGKKICIINEGMHLLNHEIEKFCSYIFDQYNDVHSIEFHAVQVTAPVTRWPGVYFRCTEDIVILLPKQQEDFLQQLGKSTRKNLRKHLAKAQRALPGFRFDIKPGNAVPEQVIQQIIRFNHARMADKRRISALTGEPETRLIRLIQQRGMVGMIHVNNQLSGGSLACRVGKDLYSLVNAHDPQFNAYSLGNLCRYLMIMHAIDSGDQRFHLLGGNFHSKQDMLGRRQLLDHCVFYRSVPYMLRDIGNIAALGLQAVIYHGRNWLQAQKHLPEKNLLAQVFNRAVNSVRQLRRKTGNIQA